MEVDTTSRSCAYKKRDTELFKDNEVSREDVEMVIQRSLGPGLKVINFHVRTFSEEKLGFMGAHRHLVVTIQKDDGSGDKEIRTFFLKSIPHEIEEQAAIIEETKIFFKEANFYQLIMPELMISLKDKSWIAECYLVKKDALIFEDLKSRNFEIKEKILDTVILKSALTGLAKLHASSILAEERLGKSLIEIYPKVLQESLFSLDSRFGEWFRTGMEVAVAVARSLGLRDPTSIPKICHRIFELVSASKKRRNVVCHGDVWSYNLMFDDSKPVPTCVLVDYQLIRYAPAMVDVAQLLYLTTRRPYREAHEEELLKHYHEIFSKTLRDNCPGIESENFSELLQEYEEMRLVGIVTAALYFPINQIEGKLCAEMTKDSDGFSKLLFKDRVELVLKLMKKDQNYKGRITEVIKEMVERSKQLLV